MRALLTLYILLVLFVVGVTLGCAWGLIDAAYPQYWLSLLYGDLTVIWIVSIICIGLVILSLALMFSGIRKRKPKSARISLSEGGAIFVTLSALEEMATRHIAENSAVRSVNVRVSVRDGKANFSAKMMVVEGTCIPDVLKGLQASMKTHIETLSGIEVGKIILLVDKTAQVVKARVE
jgi:uncharacterized alkaline shock family protein YloU